MEGSCSQFIETDRRTDRQRQTLKNKYTRMTTAIREATTARHPLVLFPRFPYLPLCRLLFPMSLLGPPFFPPLFRRHSYPSSALQPIWGSLRNSQPTTRLIHFTRLPPSSMLGISAFVSSVFFSLPLPSLFFFKF